MVRETTARPLAGVEAVRQGIEEWRQTRVSGRAMPTELWSAAVKLAAQHGPYPVAQALRIDYGGLKKRLHCSPEQNSPAASRPPEAVGFLELAAAPLLGRVEAASEWRVELRGADGTSLRIQLPGSTPLDVPGLVAAFWRRS